MSSSTDSLKKKVCVTVFLDELFEEVEEEERREPIQVSQVAESVAKIEEKPLKEPSRVDLGNDERINVCSNADTEQNQVQVRPRKHRRESKFSKNRYDSFKNELSKYGYGSGVTLENEARDQVDSTVSDSDFDLDEFLGLDKWTPDKSRASFTELSEGDFTEDSFLSITPVLSSTATACHQEKLRSPPKSDAHPESSTLYRRRSTQYGGPHSPTSSTRLPHHFPPEKDLRKPDDDASPCPNTQTQIQLILPGAQAPLLEKEACEGDRVRHFDLKSILEESVYPDDHLDAALSNASTDFNDSDAQDPSNSYTCVFARTKASRHSRPPEVKRVWASTRRAMWNDGLESDLSEADGITLRSIQNDSLLCYALCLKCKDSDLSFREEKKCEGSVDKLAPSRSRSSRRTICRDPSTDNLKAMSSRDASLVFRAAAHLADKAILGTTLKAEPEKTEGDPAGEAPEGSETVRGRRSKNFAEGDTIAKASGGYSKCILDVDKTEKLFVYDEILKRVDESRATGNETTADRAQIELRSQEEAQEGGEKLKPSPRSATASEVLAEVFFNQKRSESLEKNLLDAESEMVFAESENFYDGEDFFCGAFSLGPAPSLTLKSSHLQNDVCVLEFEDKLSRSKILRRMKTVEILGDNSLNDMKNISTEVILICEDISNNELCLEAWQSSASTLRSLTEVNQCYLKDSTDSAMYLIEIPLHFVPPKKPGASVSDHFFKPSDSD